MVTIRQANQKDISAIAELYIKTWRYAYKGFLPAHFLKSLSVEYYKKVRKHHQENTDPVIAHFVAEHKGKIVGFCDVGPNRDQNVDSDCAELYSLYVDPKMMGQGIGALLVWTGKDWLKKHGFSSATVWVLEEHSIGRRFYEERDWQLTTTSREVTQYNLTYREVRYKTQL